ncbi:hypothetical protein LH29_10575 [Draconibacterium sediminis]|uniref:histidine kinase n=2 Tax=Draconibacterium sediminis TaxID=1544798 RepID=A0A0D8JCM5_9BACT|nr:hypothetical protein LH29_10575 [Draconibacterium sediminis]
MLFRKISPDGGFSYGFVNAIAEDSYGFIWFGTDNGLFKYDTQEITRFLKDDKPGSIPSNNILALFCSNKKKLWIVTDEGLCYYDQHHERFVAENYIEPGSVSLNSNIRDIKQNSSGDYFTLHTRNVCQIDTLNHSYKIIPIKFINGDTPSTIFFDHSDVLWVGTNQGNIFKSPYPYTKIISITSLRNASIRTICEDNNSLWFGYEWGGVDHLTRDGALIDHLDHSDSEAKKLPHNRVRKIIKNSDNNIWIGTYKGLYILSRTGYRLIQSDIYNELPHNSIKELFMDSHNGIWIGTWSGGLAYYNSNDNRFLHFKKNSDPNSIQSNIISSFAEDADQKIWVGTEDNGLQFFERDLKEFRKFKLKKSNGSVTNIKCLALGQNEQLWVGTLFDGLWKIDLKSLSYEKIDFFKSLQLRIYSLREINTGLWIGTYGDGLFYLDFNSKEIQRFIPVSGDDESISSGYIRTILSDNNGGLWLGTHNGLNYLAKGSSKFHRYFTQNQDSLISSISNNEIYALLEDSSGKIWIGTANGLNSFEPITNKFEVYKKDSGLSGVSIFGIEEDAEANLWISTENGISILNLKDKSIRTFDTADGLQGKQFNPGASFKCENEELLFGGPNGFNIINPTSVKKNPAPSNTIITNLFIDNKIAGVNEPDNKIQESIVTSKKIVLQHQQNSLTFEFISTNFIQPEKNKFKYRLVNYDNNWIYSGKENKAVFTKIPPGQYTFEVLSSNNNGIWSSTPRKLQIEIIPPIWARWYAFTIYLILLILILWYIRKGIIMKQCLKRDLLVEKVKNENEEKLSELKMKFFTNVTHEFRTPLTLIMSPLDYILRKNNYEQDTQEHLDIIKRNAVRLKILIDQIIDFRKLELGKTTYCPVSLDLIKFCSDIYSSFGIYAKDRSIEYIFQAPKQDMMVFADSDKIEKILFNLLSNAFKYTSDKGEIEFSVKLSPSIEMNRDNGFLTNTEIQGEGVEISIRNTGNRIEEQEIHKLFNRFYSDSRGTGIGLHLCKEYAMLHNGAIAVFSNDVGTIFSLIIPTAVGDIEESTEEHEISKKILYTEKNQRERLRQSGSQKTILVAEDNPELLRYMKNLLREEFNVLTAENGIQAVEIANELDPQLIISDILMPEMDGLELCDHLKQDIHTSHIPIILLTALSEKEKKINGFSLGADAYIEKPFDDQVLLAQIKGILKTREQLQQCFKKSFEQWTKDSILLPFDKQLIEKAIKITEEHLLDETFTVENLASELNFSRSSLHRKLRDLTDQSATEFIRSVRLNKALTLMKQGNYNMEEVSYAVGFSSPSYFSQSFKKHFNKSPKAYLEEVRQLEN